MNPLKQYISGIIGLSTSAGTLAVMSLNDLDILVRIATGIVGLLTGVVMLLLMVRKLWRGR